MATTWKATPVFSPRSITELHDAIYLVGGSPAVWTDGTELPPNTTLRKVHLTEVLDAIQRLWNDRDLGLIPNWTNQADPGSPRESHITDLRKWFNHWESWGDLRGVHWWDPDSTPALPKVGWNVESVIALAKGNNEYDRGAVDLALSRCTEARNYGLVNIVRLDWKAKHAAPRSSDDYGVWTAYFTEAVNRLKGVASLFIVGNEPNIESGRGPHNNETRDQGLLSFEYALAFKHLYSHKVPGTKYLAAGPAIFAHNYRGNDDEIDTLWLERVKDTIVNVDGWALHTYGAPYLNYAGTTDDANELCDEPSHHCPVSRNDDVQRDPYAIGDAGFRRYSDYIDIVRGEWPTKPIYITETNTSGYKAKDFNKPTPLQSYATGWIRKTYTEIRNFNTEKNAERTSWPRILCLCWFVDSDRDPNWADYALSNGNSVLQQARADFIASDTSTGILPGNPTSNLAPWVPILEHTTGTRILSGTVS